MCIIRLWSVANLHIKALKSGKLTYQFTKWHIHNDIIKTFYLKFIGFYNRFFPYLSATCFCIEWVQFWAKSNFFENQQLTRMQAVKLSTQTVNANTLMPTMTVFFFLKSSMYFPWQFICPPQKSIQLEQMPHIYFSLTFLRVFGKIIFDNNWEKCKVRVLDTVKNSVVNMVFQIW